MNADSAVETCVGMGLDALECLAAEYAVELKALPVRFSSEPYTRIVLSRDESLEVGLICFAAGQTSSVHDHRGSNCVIRVLKGKVLETHFADAGDGTLAHAGHHYPTPGSVSGLDGEQLHQLSNVDTTGSVILNFYSPPFQS